MYYSKDVNQNNRRGIKGEKKSCESSSHDVINHSNPLLKINHSTIASRFIKIKIQSVLPSTIHILIKDRFFRI